MAELPVPGDVQERPVWRRKPSADAVVDCTTIPPDAYDSDPKMRIGYLTSTWDPHAGGDEVISHLCVVASRSKPAVMTSRPSHQLR
jgi:hypothetical protein